MSLLHNGKSSDAGLLLKTFPLGFASSHICMWVKTQKYIVVGSALFLPHVPLLPFFSPPFLSSQVSGWGDEKPRRLEGPASPLQSPGVWDG